jgi:predicted DNA-binding transcriptional regulator YafY
MFTPEFSSAEKGEFVLVASHSLENSEAVGLSIEYNKARIAYGLSQVPEALRKCRLVYDVRGQQLGESVLAQVRAALESTCVVEFKL